MPSAIRYIYDERSNYKYVVLSSVNTTNRDQTYVYAISKPTLVAVCDQMK